MTERAAVATPFSTARAWPRSAPRTCPPDLPPRTCPWGSAPGDLPLGICPWDLPLGPAATSDREPDTPDGSERDGKAVGGGTGHAGEKSIHQDRAVELSFCLCDRIEKFI
jgi:hypothetical protein